MSRGKQFTKWVEEAKGIMRAWYESGEFPSVESLLPEYKKQYPDCRCPTIVTVRSWSAKDKWVRGSAINEIRERVRKKILNKIIQKNLDDKIVDKIEGLLDSNDETAIKNGIVELCKILDVYPGGDKQTIEIQIGQKLEIKLDEIAKKLIPVILEYVPEDKRLNCVDAVEASFKEIK